MPLYSLGSFAWMGLLNTTTTRFLTSKVRYRISIGLSKKRKTLKVTQMGPLLVLVSPCFREKVNGSCKIVSFLISLDKFLLKNVIVFFFWKSNFKMALVWKKKGYFDLLFTFLVAREKHKNSFSTFPIYIHTHILLTLLIFFLPSPFCKKKKKKKKKMRIYHVRFLFGVTSVVNFLSRHFGAINK